VRGRLPSPAVPAPILDGKAFSLRAESLFLLLRKADGRLIAFF
jgi:hypothetical protein